MRKTAVYLALFGILVSGAGLALADEMPPGMKMVPASKPSTNADPGASSRAYMQGMSGGMHDRMKRDHHMRMRDMRQSGMARMAPSEVRPMQASRGC